MSHCSLIPNDLRTGTWPQTKGWRPLVYVKGRQLYTLGGWIFKYSEIKIRFLSVIILRLCLKSSRCHQVMILKIMLNDTLLPRGLKTYLFWFLSWWRFQWTSRCWRLKYEHTKKYTSVRGVDIFHRWQHRRFRCTWSYIYSTYLGNTLKENGVKRLGLGSFFHESFMSFCSQ